MPAATADDIRLILRLARGDAARVEQHLRARPASLEQLADAAVDESLSVVLLNSLEHLPPGTRLAAARLEALESRRSRQRARMTGLLDALADIAQRLTSAGQPFILLKGPYLAERYYGDIGGREFVNLNLLVPRPDRHRASQLIEAAGYRRRSHVLGGENLTSFFVHGFDFANAAASIDLHWRLSRHPSLRMDEARLWAMRSARPVGGLRVEVLSDEHEVVFAVLSLLRDIERGRPKAKNVLDLIQIAAAADATIDWDALFDRGQHDGTFGPLVNVLALSVEVGGAHDLVPRLAATLARHASRRVQARPSGSLCGFAPRPLGLGNKWWSARAHDTTPAGWFVWWAVSLPFRMAVHRRVRPAGAAKQA